MSKEAVTGEGYIEDPRYSQCGREARAGLLLGLCNFLWWFAWGYGLGSQDPAEYTYIFGFPLWFFMSCLVGAVLFTGLAVFIVHYYYRDIPLEAMSEDEARAFKEVMHDDRR